MRPGARPFPQAGQSWLIERRRPCRYPLTNVVPHRGQRCPSARSPYCPSSMRFHSRKPAARPERLQNAASAALSGSGLAAALEAARCRRQGQLAVDEALHHHAVHGAEVREGPDVVERVRKRARTALPGIPQLTTNGARNAVARVTGTRRRGMGSIRPASTGPSSQPGYSSMRRPADRVDEPDASPVPSPTNTTPRFGFCVGIGLGVDVRVFVEVLVNVGVRVNVKVGVIEGSMWRAARSASA